MKNLYSTLTELLPLLVIAGSMAVFSAQPAVAQVAGNVDYNACVGSKDIRDDGIKSREIKDGQVKSVALANHAVTSGKIADGTAGKKKLLGFHAMDGIQIVIFLVRCSESLLLCQDLSSEHLRFSSMAACQAERPALIKEAHAPGANRPVVMAKCRYRLAQSDRPRGMRTWQSASFQ